MRERKPFFWKKKKKKKSPLFGISSIYLRGRMKYVERSLDRFFGRRLDTKHKFANT